jgi:YHS domain-containing protein
MIKILRRVLALTAAGAFAALMLGGCTALPAQNPSGALSPVNAVAQGSDKHLMLKGADVVAYFVDNQFVQGSPQHSSIYQDVTFHFASAGHKAMFDKAPAKYQPQYGGFCANGIAYAIPWGGDADTWRLIDGKLYIFGGQGSRDGFDLDVPLNIQRADRYWADEVAGSNSFWQRSKRLVFRVPHYLSGEELAKEVAAAKAKKG